MDVSMKGAFSSRGCGPKCRRGVPCSICLSGQLFPLPWLGRAIDRGTCDPQYGAGPGTRLDDFDERNTEYRCHICGRLITEPEDIATGKKVSMKEKV